MAPSLGFRTCSAVVIKCFKKVEHGADWITGAAGPFFVALCWILIVGSGIAFFDVIFPTLGLFTIIVLSPVFIVLPLNLYGHYYLVTHIPPGFPAPTPTSAASEQKWLIPDERSLWWAKPRKGRKGWRRLSTVASKVGSMANADTNVEESEESESDISRPGSRKRLRRCRKCDGPKPERTHHCRVCKRCVLLMDHHCPWINNCVGLHNYRYFILFMAYLSLCCWTVAALGYNIVWTALEFDSDWHAKLTPRIAFVLVYVLCVAIGVAVPVLLSWHLYLLSRGETSIESHDNAYLEDKAAEDGLTYVNPYDHGRKKNFELFFNVGADGYPLRTLLLPQIVPPYTAGWEWQRVHSPLHGLRRNREKGFVVGDRDGEDALTDDEMGGGGWIEVDDPRMPPGTGDESSRRL